MPAPDPYQAAQYKDPANGTESSIGPQVHTSYWMKQALIDARKEAYFGQLAEVFSMPKNFGKEIVRMHYVPMLDDRNMNDQGIDAAGATITASQYYVQLASDGYSFAVEADATAAAAAVNAIEAGTAVKSGAVTPWLVTFSKVALKAATLAQAQAVLAAVPGSSSRQGSGNLYGSSKDVGSIVGKMPTLTEVGGRVNRVGFKRVLLKGKLEKYGFFREYTQESLDFDSDAELEMHVNREMLKGANEITEALLQIDLLNSAGVVRYPGAATQDAELGFGHEVTYDDLMRLNIDLNNNRAPSGTKMITGTRFIDTKTIPGARPLYVGSELIPTLRAMKDSHGNPAFISIEKYAAGGNTFLGEIGAVDQFRIIVNPEMFHWAGAGAKVDPVADPFHDMAGRYTVFPMLCIASEAFTTVGFQTDGKNVKFKIYNKKPGEETADRNDPYGEMGFMSIKWYYGFMAFRPEWIALIKTVARL